MLPGAEGAVAMAGGATPSAAGRCFEAGPFTPAEADAALARWRERGVQTANIVPREQANGGLMLRVESADAALAAQLTATASESGTVPFGKAFAPCAK